MNIFEILHQLNEETFKRGMQSAFSDIGGNKDRWKPPGYDEALEAATLRVREIEEKKKRKGRYR